MENICCGKPTILRTFRVLVSTDNPKVVEMKQLNCSVCEHCRSFYVAKTEKLITTRIVALGKDMSKVLFGV